MLSTDAGKIVFHHRGLKKKPQKTAQIAQPEVRMWYGMDISALFLRPRVFVAFVAVAFAPADDITASSNC